jgi:hypothetical protein
MAVTFTKAVKESLKLRLALDGPAGSGKSYSALRIGAYLARQSGGRLRVIDSERQSAKLYADEFDFDHCDLDGDYSPERYIEAIDAACADGKCGCLIIDSMSHAWDGVGGVLEKVDNFNDREKFSKGWRQVTPIHNRLVDAVLRSDTHVIVTLRTKIDYVQEKNEQGRTQIVKKGLKPVQREGVDYEFTIVGDMEDQQMLISKTRCKELTGKRFVRPGEDVAGIIWTWLNAGEKPAAKPAPAFTPASTPANTTPAATPAEKPAEKPLSDDEYTSFLEDFDAAAAERNLDVDTAMLVLADAFMKLMGSSSTPSASVADKCLAALRDGKWDSVITKRFEALKAACQTPPAAPAGDAPAAPPSEPQPAPQKLTSEIMARIGTIDSFEQFNTMSIDLAGPAVNDVEFAHGIKKAVQNIQRVGRENHISKIKLREWAMAIAGGTFDWATGKVTAKPQDQAKAA